MGAPPGGRGAGTNLEDVGQLAQPGAFGEQQGGGALAGHVVQVQLEPDGAHLGDGRADVLQAQTQHLLFLLQSWNKPIKQRERDRVEVLEELLLQM